MSAPARRPTLHQRVRTAVAARGSPASDLAGEAFGGDSEAAVAFFASLVQRGMVVAQHQTAWTAALREAAAAARANGAPVASSKDCAPDEFCVLYSCGEAALLRGYYRYPAEIAAAWIAAAMLAIARRPVRASVDLPCTLVEAALASPCKPLKAFVFERMLRREPQPAAAPSAAPPPPSLWASFDAFVAAHPSVRRLVYQDERLREAFDAQAARRSNAAARGAQARRDAGDRTAPPVAPSLDVSSTRLLYAGFVYAMFRCHERGLESALRRAFPGAVSDDDARPYPLSAQLFPIVVRFFEGTVAAAPRAGETAADLERRQRDELREVLPSHPLLLALGKDAARDAVRALSSVAEEMREVAMAKELRLVGRAGQGAQILNHVVGATKHLDHIVDLYRQELTKALAEWTRCAPAGVRSRYREAREASATEFFHRLWQSGEHDELDRLLAWSRDVCDAGCKPEPSIVRRGRAPDDRPPSEWADAADMLRHLDTVDGEYAALTFGDGVLACELHATMERYLRRYPALLGAVRRSPAGAPPAPPGARKRARAEVEPLRAGESAESRSFFVGVSGAGPFLFARRKPLELLRRLMLKDALLATRATKSVPVFPLLARLYFTAFTDSAYLSDRQRRLGEGGADDEDDEEEDDEEGACADDASLDCVASALAHWLRAGARPAAGDEDATRRRKASSSSPATDAAPASFVPQMGGTFFRCLRALHRFADQMERAAEARLGRREFDAPALEAVRTFLELLRPRSARLGSLRELKRRLEARRLCGGDNADLYELLVAVDAAYSTRPEPSEDELVPLSYSGKLRGAYEIMYARRTDGRRPTVEAVDPGERCALLNWLVALPFLNCEIRDADFVRRFFCEGGLRAEGREPLRDSDLEDAKLYVGAQELADLSSFVRSYAEAFVCAYPRAAGGARLAEPFVESEEPMGALSRLLREVECRVSGKRFREAVARIDIDVDAFLEDRPERECSRPSNASLLPVAVAADASGKPHAYRFVYFELSLHVVTFAPTPSMLPHERTAAEFIASDGPARAAAALALDLALRYGRELDLGAIVEAGELLARRAADLCLDRLGSSLCRTPCQRIALSDAGRGFVPRTAEDVRALLRDEVPPSVDAKALAKRAADADEVASRALLRAAARSMAERATATTKLSDGDAGLDALMSEFGILPHASAGADPSLHAELERCQEGAALAVGRCLDARRAGAKWNFH